MKTTYRQATPFDDSSFKQFGIYPFTNENVAGYIKPVIKAAGGHERVLTVAASGDHAINAIHHGAKEITEFDRNQKALYYSELKKVLLCHLSFEEFQSFYSRHTTGRADIIKSIKNDLSEECKIFWENENKRHWKEQNSIYEANYPAAEDFCINSGYLASKANYKKTQLNMHGVKTDYLHTLIQNLAKDIGDQQFDYAMLSNIQQYYNANNKVSNANNLFEKDITVPLLKNCTAIQSRYWYSLKYSWNEAAQNAGKLGAKATPILFKENNCNPNSTEHGILLVSK